jgi:hypothetical protein
LAVEIPIAVAWVLNLAGLLLAVGVEQSVEVAIRAEAFRSEAKGASAV